MASPGGKWWTVYRADEADARRCERLGQVKAENQPRALLAAFERFAPADNTKQRRLFVRDALAEAEGQRWCEPTSGAAEQ